MLMKDDTDPQIETMLSNMDEVEVAIEISKILTAALVKQMQSKMRGKINLQLGTLNSQKLQLSAVEKALLKTPNLNLLNAPQVGSGNVGRPAMPVLPLPLPAKGLPQPLPVGAGHA